MRNLSGLEWTRKIRYTQASLNGRIRASTWYKSNSGGTGSISGKSHLFAPGIFAETYPEQLKEIAEAGHEIALHGYRHEDFGGLSKEQQQSALNQGAKAIEQTIGRMPVGFRLPEGGCTEETLTLIQQAGFLYDNSFLTMIFHIEFLGQGHMRI